MPSGPSLVDILKDLSVADGDDKVEDSLVIGIDFGTTYSGVAWTTRVDFENNQVNLITSWPDHGREEGKAPTELWYEDDDDNEPVWSYGVPADEDPYRWFKLLLLRTEDLDVEVRQSNAVVRVREMMEKSGRTAVGLIADYLRLLWEHTLSTIERARGEDIVKALAIHVVITVPAVWKGYAREAMKDAAAKSGIMDSRLAGPTKLTLVPEPEAAALSTLLEQGSGVRPGNLYVICDAGGGTVDLISYLVKSTKPIVLQEAVEGTGGLCGGIFIDQAFEHMCSGRLGSKWKRLSKTGIREIMKKEWEYGIKPQFTLTRAKKEYVVSLPAEAFNQGSSALDDTKREPHIKNGRIHFSASHIKKVFEDVFTDIEELIDQQIRKAKEKGLSVTGIILVGGLGSSPYLYEYLKSLHSEAGIAVLQSGGIKPRTAICRGAVLKGFVGEHDNELDPTNVSAPILVASTVSRASYGILYRTPFDPLKHLEEDKIWQANEGVWCASRQMNWYLKKGEIVSKIQPVSAYWYRLYENWEFDGTLSVMLYQCEDELPPTRYMPSVQRLGKLHCDLDVQYADLPDFQSKRGITMKKLAYRIELVPSGASVDFVLHVNGRKQGSQNVKIQFS